MMDKNYVVHAHPTLSELNDKLLKSAKVDIALVVADMGPLTDEFDFETVLNFSSHVWLVFLYQLPKIRNMGNLNGWLCSHCKIVQNDMSFAAFVMHQTSCFLKMKQTREPSRGGRGGRGGRGRQGR